MADERAASEERLAAIEAAIQILADARAYTPPKALPQLGRVASEEKVRIRGGNFRSGGLSAAILVMLVGMYGAIAFAYVRTLSVADREDRALALLTSPDVSPIHMTAQSGFAVGAEGTYWRQSGTDVAVLTLTGLPVGTRYEWRVQHRDRWTDLGGGTVDQSGTIHLIASSPDVAMPPDGIQVTLVAENDEIPAAPSVLSWRAIPTAPDLTR